MDRRLITALLCALTPLGSFAAVEVETSTALSRESVDLPARSLATYKYTLDAGSELVFSVRLARWGSSPLRVWLVSEGNYERLIAGSAFDYFDTGTGMIRREGQISFAPANTGAYRIVLDNSHSSSRRELEIYAYVRTDEPQADDERARTFYEDHFQALSDLIDMGDIDIHVRRCGRVNAFAIGSRVVICRELDNLLTATATPGVRRFVLLHEVSHSLISHWGYRSIVRNQFLVDRLAAALFSMLDQEGYAEPTAHWFLQQVGSANESTLDESLVLAKSRARRIAAWLLEDGELDRIWTRRIVVPRIRTGALERLVRAAHLDEQSRRRIELELTDRLADGALERAGTERAACPSASPGAGSSTPPREPSRKLAP